ncbi:DNA-binding protein [Rhodobacteraceae bacterium D3-12]|nr:DNA-binding protein [Rhodobacteraceae bacterium D3-12]
MSKNTASDLGPIDPLLTAREGAKVLNISLPTFWRRVADGTITRPVKLGAASRWPQSEIVAVIEAAKADRDDA